MFGLERMTTLAGQGKYHSCLPIKEIVVLRVKWIAESYVVSELIMEPG